MPVFLSVPLCVLMGYLMGCFNPAYLFARAKGFDIRETGSGNAGASNAAITMGKGVGVVSALLDIFKAWLAVKLALHLFPALTYAPEIAGTFCILGHIFPVFMHFRGGKGLACLGGVILAFNVKVFLVALLAELLLVLITNYICFAAISMSIIYPILYGFMTARPVGALILALVIPAILYKHIENLRRIRAGTEARFSSLWHREADLERIAQNSARGVQPDSTDKAPDDEDKTTRNSNGES